MANKNTRARKAAFRKSIKTGESKVISASPSRNMQQVVYKNEGGGSITCHEPIDRKKSFVTNGKVSTEKRMGDSKKVQNSNEPVNAASFGEEK